HIESGDVWRASIVMGWLHICHRRDYGRCLLRGYRWILWALARYINFADIRCDVGFSKYFISHCYCCHVGPIVKKRVDSDRFSKCTDFWQTDPFKSAQFKRGGLYRGGAIDWYE